jgi:hypothetical protein
MEDQMEEIKRLMRKNLSVSEECLQILKKMHRAQLMGRLLKVLKWLIIVALALGAYYYAQPYMDTFWQAMTELRQGLVGLKSVGNTATNLPPTIFEKFQDVLKQ